MERTNSAWTRRLLGKVGPTSEEPVVPAEVVPPPPPAVVIEPGVTLDGRLVTDRLVQVDGDFRGSIETELGVVVAESGSVVGDIRARSVAIHGAVVGNVNGSRDVALRAGARLQGDVVTSCFELEKGAYFNGHTRMLRPQDSSRRGAAEAPLPGAPL